MKFSEKIIKIRKEKGLSQEEFGNEINVSRQAISKWESEQSQPDLDNVREISKKFNVSIEYLVNEELEEDIKKEPVEEIKKQRKNMKYKILKILLIIITIYLFIAIIKYIRFTQIYNKAKNMDENQNYNLDTEFYYKDNITGENFKGIDNYNNYNGISLHLHYDEDYNSNPTSMNYIDWNIRKNYFFTKIANNKYEYEEVDLEWKSPEEFNIKGTTLRYAPASFLGRVLFALDPTKYVSLFKNTVKFNYIDGYTIFIFDDDTGEIREVMTITDKISTYIYFSYEWNESLINDGDVENPLVDPEIECVKIEYSEQ